MVDFNLGLLIQKHRQLDKELRALEGLLWASAESPQRLEATGWSTGSLLARIDELDAALIEIERLLPDPKDREL